MATIYVLNVSGNDKAGRATTRSWYVKSAPAIAWLADPSVGAIKDFVDGYLGCTGIASPETYVYRKETPVIPGLFGSEYRGNAVQVSGQVVTNGIGSAIRTSIPARVNASLPIAAGTINVLVTPTPTDPNGYDPLVYVNWDKFISGYEAIVDSEEGGDVTNITKAYLND